LSFSKPQRQQAYSGYAIAHRTAAWKRAAS